MSKKAKLVLLTIGILVIFFIWYKLIFKPTINPKTLFPGKWSFEEDIREDAKLIVYNFNEKGEIIQLDFGLNNSLPISSTIGIYEIIEDSIIIKFNNWSSKEIFFIVKTKTNFKLIGTNKSDNFILTRINNLEKYYN